VRSPSRFAVALVALCLAALALNASSAAADVEVVEGLVYDGWCGTTDAGECPSEPSPECLRTFGCHLYRPLDVDGLFVNVRRQNSTKVIDTLVPTEGRFSVELRPGRYVFHAIAPEELCLSGQLERLWIKPGVPGPFYLPVGVYGSGSWSAAKGECIPYPHP
jgi:hypothetical protein